MITLRYRTVVAFFTGVTVLIVAGLAFQTWRADAASEGANTDSMFVPITPCRLVDTRPDFNIGERNTPLGADETHVQPVTGAIGNCNIPVDATGVSMNVTAVEPTAASFMTIFPSNAAQPVVSNLNYLPGAPPTPNKVDVKLSVDGRASFYNLAGTVHLIADVAGYYTPIDARTVTRSISLPAHALGENSNRAAVVEEQTWLRWSTAHAPEYVDIDLHRPPDWTGSGTATIKILLQRTTDIGGAVQFEAFLNSCDADTGCGDRFWLKSTRQTVAGSGYLREVEFQFASDRIPNDWWRIELTRSQDFVGEYPDDVKVYSVEVTYEAKN